MNHEINSITNNFGIEYNSDYICSSDSLNNADQFYITKFDSNHQIYKDLVQYTFYWGGSLTAKTPASVIAFTNDNCWQDNGNQKFDSGEQFQSFPILAVSQSGNGRVVCLSDDSFQQTAFSNWNNQALMMSILSWFDENYNNLTNIENPDDNYLNRQLPSSFSFSQNYPNPFNINTVFLYQLPRTSNVKISIHNNRGQLIHILLDERKKAGYFEAVWDGKNNYSHTSATGIYFIKFQTDDFKDVKKILLLK